MQWYHENMPQFFSLLCFSLQVLVLAAQSLVETIMTNCDQDSSLLVQFFTLLTPTQTEWTRIRQALPPQVRQPVHIGIICIH